MNPQEPAQPQPQQPDDQNTPQVVFMSRPHEPIKQPISADAQKRHEDSRRKYPDLNLSEGEFILSAVQRHPIGLFQIWAIVGIVGVIVLGFLGALSVGSLASFGAAASSAALIAIPLLLVMILALLFGFIETMVYNANKFFLTNESVIQQIQTSLFARREQTVSLANVEDASYTQNGIIPHIFNYGMIRLSTQGDETTYRFKYASSPKQQIALLNNAVEAFKNGRPVTVEDSEIRR